MNTVQQILKMKGNRVWTISKDSTVLDALKRMAEKHIGAIVVMDGEKVVGIFSERDHARKGVLIGKRADTTRVNEVMTSDLITVSPDQTIQQCMSLMTDRRVRHLPVCDGDQLVGLVSIGDVVKDMIEELEFMNTQLEKYITGVR
jgi:CBS domain-containing protein